MPSGGVCWRSDPAVLVGVATCAVVSAFMAATTSDEALSGLFRFVIVPLFLFSGAFFPLDELPEPSSRSRGSIPVWHGVELARAVALGIPTRMAGRSTSGPRPGPGGRDRVGRAVLHPEAAVGERRPPDAAGRTASSSSAVRITPPWCSGAPSGSSSATSWSTGRNPWCSSSALVEPVLYLFALGVGLGALVGEVTGPGGHPGQLRRVRRPRPARGLGDERCGLRVDLQPLQQAEVRAPLRRDARHPGRRRDIAVGETTWALLRGSLYSAAFLAIAGWRDS
jgi:hypothetical protein